MRVLSVQIPPDRRQPRGPRKQDELHAGSARVEHRGGGTRRESGIPSAESKQASERHRRDVEERAKRGGGAALLLNLSPPANDVRPPGIAGTGRRAATDRRQEGGREERTANTGTLGHSASRSAVGSVIVRALEADGRNEAAAARRSIAARCAAAIIATSHSSSSCTSSGRRSNSPA